MRRDPGTVRIDNERLHEILWNLPLFPYMTIEVTPLAQYPSDIALLGS
ncbi:muconolactone Delta-isomerase family protein [Saccharopolyspora shandongensis]